MQAALPTTIPIFPLSGVLLLPRARLPLNIFEARYLAMTRDAMAAEKVIGMIQPTEHEHATENPPVFEVGCAGRITQFSETKDGRFLITLTGVCRFELASEIAGASGYRRVEARYGRFKSDLDEPTSGGLDRARILPTLRAYLDLHGFSTDWKAIEAASDEVLVSSLAMSCPLEPREKQALLEATDTAERSRVLTALLEMALLARGRGEHAPLQ
ncbi:MAG: peptidase S16 [Alphaproteobacteria bacterium]|nr:peptidase S16 [Alphaproteobacteria bacterium]